MRFLLLLGVLFLAAPAGAAVSQLSITTGFLRPFPGSVMARVLAANTAETISAPTGAKYVILSYTCDLYVETGGTAAVPSTDVTDGSASELNPAGYWLYNSAGAAVESFSVISADACVVTATFYK